MLIIRMWGGLGNQLFVYAFGKYLESKYGEKVKYDFNWFEKSHSFDHDINYLDDFDTNYEVACEAELNDISPQRNLEKDIVFFLAQKIPRIKPMIATTTDIICETPTSKMDKAVSGPHRNSTYEFDFESHRDYYLSGYWQSHEYADKNRQYLRNKLIPKKITDSSKNIISNFDSGEYVSVHFRKRDSGEGGNTEFSWYKQAFCRMRSKYPDATFVIFSNDIAWVTEHIQLPDSTIFFDHTDYRSAAEDIYAMSRCSHNIIGASTFSWWGAYLNENPGKTVIAPRLWGDNDMSTTDKYPKSWILI